MECSLNNENYVDVYRVEKRGRGPYSTSSWGAEALMSNRLPTPQSDEGLPRFQEDEIQKYRFGTPTAEALKEWVKYPASLDKLGFKVVHYQAKKKYTHSSEIQSMFIKRHSKRVMEWSVQDFMKEN